MSDHSEAFVAFDTSKSRNAAAIAEEGRDGEVRFLGEIENTEAATIKLARKLAAKYRRLTFCYEAGPTGYDLYRLIKYLGHDCVVAAPSLIPKKPGDRVKTNRRDALPMHRQSFRSQPVGRTARTTFGPPGGRPGPAPYRVGSRRSAGSAWQDSLAPWTPGTWRGARQLRLQDATTGDGGFSLIPLSSCRRLLLSLDSMGLQKAEK